MKQTYDVWFGIDAIVEYSMGDTTFPVSTTIELFQIINSELTFTITDAKLNYTCTWADIKENDNYFILTLLSHKEDVSLTIDARLLSYNVDKETINVTIKPLHISLHKTLEGEDV